MEQNFFTVEHQYHLYLQRVGLKSTYMHPEQRRQLKQAFYGAWGQFLMMLKHDLPEDESEMFKHLDNMVDEVSRFWNSVH